MIIKIWRKRKMGELTTTYGPEKREADDVTVDYLQKMSDDE